jgi:hypothetical protein
MTQNQKDHNRQPSDGTATSATQTNQQTDRATTETPQSGKSKETNPDNPTAITQKRSTQQGNEMETESTTSKTDDTMVDDDAPAKEEKPMHSITASKNAAGLDAKQEKSKNDFQSTQKRGL